MNDNDDGDSRIIQCVQLSFKVKRNREWLQATCESELFLVRVLCIKKDFDIVRERK